MPIYLTEADVSAPVTPAEAYGAVEASFGRLARGAVQNPERLRLELVAIETTRIVALVEADHLGRLRTAAASAVAATWLARPGAASLGILGCGRQAGAHVLAMRASLPSLDRVVVFCRDEERCKLFCRDYGCEPGKSHRDAGMCDVVVTATTSHEPVLRGEWLQPGALVCAIGANEPNWRELDDGVFERASAVFCDSRAQAKLESGDLIEPANGGLLDWGEVRELQDLLTDAVPGRANDDDIVVFKSNGLAVWDLVAAARVVELAGERGLVRVVNDAHEPTR